MRICFCLLLFSVSSLTACGNQNSSTFSQFPGFSEYLAANPPGSALPTAAERQLLTTFRPRIYLANHQTPFIDFYQDYIAHGELYEKGQLISSQVTPALLNQYRDSFTTEFRYSDPQSKSSTAVVYGRVDYDTLTYQEQSYPLTFLNYNLVFAHSGLLKGLPSWQRAAMGIVASNQDWHQLDHYVGLSIALYQQKPIAVTLQQHNYQTTYLLNANKTGIKNLTLPTDQRIQVDVALQSNELYPHSPEKQQYPGVSFVTADNIEFVETGNNKPIMAGWDITHGEREQEYTLRFLPPNDAFYTFKGRLGEKRSLPGRDGPPGAQYVTLPALMPWANRLITGLRSDDVKKEREKLRALFDEDNFSIKPAGLEAYQRDFINAVFAH